MTVRTRKFVEIALVVSVPLGMSDSAARREVRTLVNEQCNHVAEIGDVKVFSVRAGKGRFRPPVGGRRPK